MNRGRVYILGMKVTGSAILVGNTITGSSYSYDVLRRYPGPVVKDFLSDVGVIATASIVKSILYGVCWPGSCVLFLSDGLTGRSPRRHFCMLSSVEGPHLDLYKRKGFLPRDYSVGDPLWGHIIMYSPAERREK